MNAFGLVTKKANVCLDYMDCEEAQRIFAHRLTSTLKKVIDMTISVMEEQDIRPHIFTLKKIFVRILQLSRYALNYIDYPELKDYIVEDFHAPYNLPPNLFTEECDINNDKCFMDDFNMAILIDVIEKSRPPFFMRAFWLVVFKMPIFLVMLSYVLALRPFYNKLMEQFKKLFEEVKNRDGDFPMPVTAFNPIFELSKLFESLYSIFWIDEIKLPGGHKIFTILNFPKDCQ